MENFIFCVVSLELWVRVFGNDSSLMYRIITKSYSQLLFYIFHFEFIKYKVLVFLLRSPIG